MPDYESIRGQLKTGDLVLFSGKSAASNMIKLFCGSKWSHVGMVLRLRDFDNAVMLWESTTLVDIPDADSGEPNKGVQLVPLSQRIASYDAEVSVRVLNKPISRPMLQRLAAKRHHLSRRPYEKNELELLRAAWDQIGGLSRGEDLSSLFCSELVAEAYQAMGLLAEPPHGLPSNEYVPIDFSDRRALRLKRGYRLLPETVIDR